MRRWNPLRAGVGVAGAAILGALALSQAAGAAPPTPAKAPSPPAERPPPDLTGWWVAEVTQDWRYRMITPGPGEYAGIPINAAAKAVADAWDPARDAAAGEQCKGYGAGALMRNPTRLHITRLDPHTLKVEMDNGMQTRLLHFDARQVETGEATGTWQGYSTAAWDDGTLDVVTRHLRPGYIRKNGVPYSDQAQLTEYWNDYTEPDGVERLVVTSLLDDPVYLQATYGFAPIFKREADGSKWDPTPCKAQ